MPQDREQRIRNTLRNLRRLLLAVERAAIPTWLKLDLTMAQIKGLFSLAHRPAMTVGGFAEALGIGEPAASLLLDRLVRLELGTRTEDPADRRRTLASLSPKGEELVAELRHGGRSSLETWLTGLDDGDLAALDRGLSALIGNTGVEGSGSGRC